VSRGIALLFPGPRTRWGGGQPHAPAASTSEKVPVPILQDAGWAPGPVWTGGESRPHRDSIPDRPAHSQSLLIIVIMIYLQRITSQCTIYVTLDCIYIFIIGISDNTTEI